MHARITPHTSMEASGDPEQVRVDETGETSRAWQVLPRFLGAYGDSTVGAVRRGKDTFPPERAAR